MCLPGVARRSVVKSVINIVEEGRGVLRLSFTPPDPDISMLFKGWIGCQAHLSRNNPAAPVGRDVNAGSAGIIFETVEGTLQVVINDRTLAQGNASMYTTVYRTVDISSAVTPEDQFFTLSLIHLSQPTRLGMISYAV